MRFAQQLSFNIIEWHGSEKTNDTLYEVWKYEGRHFKLLAIFLQNVLKLNILFNINNTIGKTQN